MKEELKVLTRRLEVPFLGRNEPSGEKFRVK
jgi:hypothetical protein